MTAGWRSGMKRRRPVIYSDRDRRTWAQLARAAERVAADPLTDKTGNLDQAAHRREVVLPEGWRTADSPFVSLRKLGQAWSSLSAPERQAQAARLGELAARCNVILAAAGSLPSNDHVRERHRRADIED